MKLGKRRLSGKEVLSIDIGEHTTKLVTGKLGLNSMTIQHAITIPTPDGSYEKGHITGYESLRNAIQEMIHKKKIKTRLAICSVENAEVITREIAVPSVKDEQIEKMLEFEIQQYMPVQLSEYIVQHKSLEVFEEDDVKKTRIQVTAVPRELAQSYYELFKSAGLQSAVMDIQSNAIDKLVREQPFDLILKGTHHQNVVQRTFFSSTDWDLMRCSPLPVLLVKDTPWPDSGLRMTACVDPVEQGDAPRNLDKAILLQARVWQEALGTDLEVLNVYDPTPFIVYMDPPVPDTTPITEALAEQHQEALDKLLDDSGLGRNLGRLEAGTPTSSIPELVQQSGSHVVILGAQTREGIDRWLIGHTAEKILDRIRCDVLVIKTDQSGG